MRVFQYDSNALKSKINKKKLNIKDDVYYKLRI